MTMTMTMTMTTFTFTFKQQKEAYMKYECQEAGRMMMIAICEKSSY